MKNNYFKQFGLWALDVFRTNAGTIVGGLSMIGLAILCKKLNIPYQVLTEPPVSSGSNYTARVNMTKTSQPAVCLVSNDPIEVAITAIYNNARKMTYDVDKIRAAQEIQSVLTKKRETVEPKTVTYAISLLQSLTDTMRYDGDKRKVIDIISALGKGEF